MVGMKHIISPLAILCLIVSTIIVFAGAPMRVHAAGSLPIVIDRVQTGTATDVSDEVVGIYNNSADPQDISGLTIQYKSATGTSWSTRGTVPSATTLDSFTEYDFTTVESGNAKLTSGLAQAGGNLRVVAADNTILDQLAWGTGDSPEGKAIGAPIAGDEIMRQPVSDGLQALADNDDNATDFALQSIDPTPTDGGSGAAGGPGVNSDPADPELAIELNELLPDPVSPQTDAANEFIELYNPNDTAVDLAGWQLRNAHGKTFTFGEISIPAGGYLAVYSAQTKVGLTNTGDTITLLDPAGNQIDVTPNYGAAKPGLSWGLTEDGWAWTTSPTPNAANAPALVVTTASATSSTAKKATAAKRTATAKKVAAKTTKAKTSGTSALSTEDAATAKPIYNVWSWLLILAGAATIGYGAYEYRPEIKTYYHKLRAKLATGRHTGSGH